MMNYREVLAQELSRRALENAHYSLRAFARDMGLTAGSLSLILSGKRGLSLQKARIIAKKLKYSKRDADQFCDLVLLSSGRSQTLRESARQRLEARAQFKTSEISVDQFRFIADWYHLALRELVRLPNFNLDTEILAQRLGISQSQVSEAWERLCRLQIVQQNKQGEWITDDLVHTPNRTPSAAVRQFHEQILDKAKKSLRKDELALRSHTAIYFGIHSSQVEEAREKIRGFRRSLEHELAQSRSLPADRLYCLSLQFFGIDQKKK